VRVRAVVLGRGRRRRAIPVLDPRSSRGAARALQYAEFMGARATRTLTIGGVILVLAGSAITAAASVTVHVPTLSVRRSVRVTFHAKALPNHGYYYAVAVLRPYRGYTRVSPPPCATSSNMRRTDYGYPRSGVVALTLTPAKAATGHWCRGGVYSAAIYAVPHAPPCSSEYPCEKEPCVGVAPGCVHGVVVRSRTWSYPDGLPSHAYGTSIVARFTLRFPR
jgi:hypothetical protein